VIVSYKCYQYLSPDSVVVLLMSGSTDSEISVGGHTGGSVGRKKRDSAASLSSLPPDTPTSQTAPVAASNSPAAAETTPREVPAG